MNGHCLKKHPTAQAWQSPRGRRIYALTFRIFVCLFVALISSSSDLQTAVAVQLAPQIRLFQGQAVLGAQQQIEEDKSLDIASLKTDPDLEAWMDKADRYMRDGNYRWASTLWQAVLDQSGDALYSDDEKTYHSICLLYTSDAADE